LGETIILEFPRESTTILSSYFRRNDRSFSKGDKRQEQSAATPASKMAKLVLFMMVTKLNVKKDNPETERKLKNYRWSLLFFAVLIFLACDSLLVSLILVMSRGVCYPRINSLWNVGLFEHLLPL